MNGHMVAESDARVSVFDHGLLYGDGVFEGIRFYAKRAFRLEGHLERLERSAAAIRLALPYPRVALIGAVESVIAHTALDNGYLRLVITRGPGDLGLDPRSCRSPTAFVAAAPLRLFAEDAAAGIAVIVASVRQTGIDSLDPRIKSLNYLSRILARMEAVDSDASEAVMLNRQGHIAEGTGDNVFLVRDGVLLTPPPSDGALEGVTRDVVLGLAREIGLPCRQESLGAYDLYACDEAFLTGTGAGIVPIRMVDGRSIKACPGPVFCRIAAAFEALVQCESRAPQRAASASVSDPRVFEP